MRLLLLLMYSLLAGYGIAQECGTFASDHQFAYMDSVEYAPTRAMISQTQGIIDIPVQFHILRLSDGTGGNTAKEIETALQQVNKIFIQANIRLIHPDPIHFIDDTPSYETFILQLGDEAPIADKWEKNNRLNIYSFYNISVAGYAYMPEHGKVNRILMYQEALNNGSTLAHEIGHFFGLFHTHMSKINADDKTKLIEPIHREDKNNNGLKDCYETGDFCCDTPADPNIGLPSTRSFCLETCQLKGTISINGKDYEPQITNLMSYNPFKNCRTNLTGEQAARVMLFAKRDRNKLRMFQTNEGVTVKGDITFYLKNQDFMPVALDGVNLYRFTEEYTAKDEFTFDIKNESSTNLYISIINMDQVNQEVTKVFPIVSFGDKPFIHANKTLHPFSNSYISLSPLTTETSTKEYTCILLSLQPFDATKAASEMNYTSGNFTNKLYKVLGERLLPLDHVVYEDGNFIGFNAQLKENEILPIIVEMIHIQ